MQPPLCREGRRTWPCPQRAGKMGQIKGIMSTFKIWLQIWFLREPHFITNKSIHDQ